MVQVPEQKHQLKQLEKDVASCGNNEVKQAYWQLVEDVDELKKRLDVEDKRLKGNGTQVGVCFLLEHRNLL